MRVAFVGVLLLLVGLSSKEAGAQTPNATLRVTVVDSTGAVLPGATVTVAGIDPANRDAVTDLIAFLARRTTRPYEGESR